MLCLVHTSCVNPVALLSVFVIGAVKPMLVWTISVGTVWLISITEANEGYRTKSVSSFGR